MLEPKFNHDEGFLWKATGVPPHIWRVINEFQKEYGISPLKFSSASLAVEYYWERISEELKVEPFICFYLGMFVESVMQRSIQQRTFMN